MIHATASRNSAKILVRLRLDITGESLDHFRALLQRALNTWDEAPQELKELGDRMMHGVVLQEYRPVSPEDSSLKWD